MARLSGQLAILFLLLVGAFWGLVLSKGPPDWTSVEEFVEAHGDPCSLPSGGIGTGAVEWSRPYLDLPSLVNDADLILTGRPGGHTLDNPSPSTAGAPILVTLQLADVLKGFTSGPTIKADLSGRVSGGPKEVVHIINIDLDSCSDDLLLLFFRESGSGEALQVVGYQGWANIEAGDVRPGDLNQLFKDYSTSQSLLESVRQIAQQQAGQAIPKGRVRCEAMRPSEQYRDPPACPGDTFNPYEAYALGGEIAEAFIVPTDPGPSPLALPRVDLAPDDPRLLALTLALKTEVTVQPLDAEPQDVIHVSLTPKGQLADQMPAFFDYSPSTHTVRMPGIGQFDAPPAFEGAIQPFLAAAPAQ